MSNETQMTKEQQLKIDASMGQKLYSIRAKFYDRYNIKRDIDYDIKDLIFSKLDELEKGGWEVLNQKSKLEERIEESESACKIKDASTETLIKMYRSLEQGFQSLKDKLTVENIEEILNKFPKDSYSYDKAIAQALIKELK